MMTILLRYFCHHHMVHLVQFVMYVIFKSAMINVHGINWKLNKKYRSFYWLLYFCDIVFAEISGKLNERVIKIFSVLAGIFVDVLPSLQFVLLIYSFGSTRGGEITFINYKELFMWHYEIVLFVWTQIKYKQSISISIR